MISLCDNIFRYFYLVSLCIFNIIFSIFFYRRKCLCHAISIDIDFLTVILYIISGVINLTLTILDSFIILLLCDGMMCLSIFFKIKILCIENDFIFSIILILGRSMFILISIQIIIFFADFQFTILRILILTLSNWNMLITYNLVISIVNILTVLGVFLCLFFGKIMLFFLINEIIILDGILDTSFAIYHYSIIIFCFAAFCDFCLFSIYILIIFVFASIILATLNDFLIGLFIEINIFLCLFIIIKVLCL